VGAFIAAPSPAEDLRSRKSDPRTIHRKTDQMGTGARGLGHTVTPKRDSLDDLFEVYPEVRIRRRSALRRGCLNEASAAQISTPHDHAMKTQGAQKEKTY
jgi:hypothetical protein